MTAANESGQTNESVFFIRPSYILFFCSAGPPSSADAFASIYTLRESFKIGRGIENDICRPVYIHSIQQAAS